MIGTSLGHYKILKRLGKGGMGEVYAAEDTKLGRRIALKVLPEEMAADPERRQRFEREARAVAALNHPNIVTLHSVEEAQGKHFITMELVEGDPLGELIPKDGLTLERFFELAVPLVDALTAAHAAGITHRDLKPANVMVGNDGRLRVLDFGLAKLRDEIRAAEGATQMPTASVTQEGKIVGTVAYMSPEQAQGKPVDPRSDVFSLGVLLYEMATGRRPFEGDTSISIISSILKDTPVSVTDLKRSLPRHLGRILKRCLAKDPGQRYQSTVDLRNELAELRDEVASGEIAPPVSVTAARGGKSSWIIAAVTVVALAVVLFVWLRERPGVVPPAETAETVAAGAVSVAVLPFANLSPDAANEYFSDGMTEELINALVKVEGLRVPARTSVFALKGKELSIGEIGHKLGVDHVLEGSVRKAGDRLRITAQLVKVDDGFHLWSETYDRQMDDVFAVQEEIARAIVGNLQVELAGGRDAPLVARSTENLEAYNLYLQGRYQWNQRTKDGVQKAIDFFRKAIDVDPDYALAYSGLADSLLVAPAYVGTPSEETYPAAEEAALRAVELDDSLAEAHTSLAGALHFEDRDARAAEREFLRALELNPRYATAHHWYGVLLMGNNRPDESIAHHEQAQLLDPLSLVIKGSYGQRLMAIGRYDDALRKIREVVEQDPASPMGQSGIADVLLRKREFEESLARLQSYEADGVYESERLRYLAEINHLLGRYDEELEWALEARKAFPDSADAVLSEAGARAALGEVETVRRLFDEALQLSGLRDGWPLVRMGLELLAHGHEEAARDLFERALDWHRGRDEDALRRDWSFANTLYAAGRIDEARDAWDAARQVAGAGVTESGEAVLAGFVAALDGDRGEARRHMERLAEFNRPTPIGTNSYYQAYIATLLGEHERAVALLREAFEHGVPYRREHHVDAIFRALRNEVGYRTMLAELGVPETAL